MVEAVPTGPTAAEPVAVEVDELELDELELDELELEPMFGQLCVVDVGLVDVLLLGLDAWLAASSVAECRLDVEDELVAILPVLAAVVALAAWWATWCVWAPAMALPKPIVPPTRARPVARAAVRLSCMGDVLLLTTGTSSTRHALVYEECLSRLCADPPFSR